MIPEYNRKSFLFALPGLGIQIICAVLRNDFSSERHATSLPQWAGWATSLGIVVGGVLFIIGLGYYARGKGYSMALGLLGFLSCLGLLILLVLPDRTKDQSPGGWLGGRG